MVAMQRILFLTDFTVEANNALDYAWDLTEKFAARLYLLHVIADPASLEHNNAQHKAKVWLDAVHRSRLEAAPNCEALVEQGDLFSCILKVIEDKAIDVIVLSAQTHQGFHLHLTANLPEKLVHRAPCHVFVVHNESVLPEAETVRVWPRTGALAYCA